MDMGIIIKNMSSNKAASKDKSVDHGARASSIPDNG